MNAGQQSMLEALLTPSVRRVWVHCSPAVGLGFSATLYQTADSVEFR